LQRERACARSLSVGCARHHVDTTDAPASADASTSPWLIEWPDCTLGTKWGQGQSIAWTHCRIYFSGAPTNILTIELMTSGTTGSMLSPGVGWTRLSMAPPIEARLMASQGQVAGALPSMIAPGQMLIDALDPQCAMEFVGGWMSTSAATLDFARLSLTSGLYAVCRSFAPHEYFDVGLTISAAASSIQPNGSPSDVASAL
jgi:hypothetical protein